MTDKETYHLLRKIEQFLIQPRHVSLAQRRSFVTENITPEVRKLFLETHASK